MVLSSIEASILRSAFKTALSAIAAAMREPRADLREEHLGRAEAAVKGRSDWLEGRVASEMKSNRVETV